MLPSERKAIKSLIEALQTELAALRREQVNAICNATKTANEKREEVKGRIVSAIVGLHTPADERTQADSYRKKAHRQQVWLTWGTWLAFIAAGIYAGIAAKQLHASREQLRE